MLVLVIEDDLHFQKICKEVFEDEGHEVLLAGNGRDALEIYEREQDRIDVVTIDILLPDIDGIYLLRKLKKIHDKIPKIMLTAYDYRDDFAALASDAYLIKSSDFEEILSITEGLAAKYRGNYSKNKL